MKYELTKMLCELGHNALSNLISNACLWRLFAQMTHNNRILNANSYTMEHFFLLNIPNTTAQYVHLRVYYACMYLRFAERSNMQGMRTLTHAVLKVCSENMHGVPCTGLVLSSPSPVRTCMVGGC